MAYIGTTESVVGLNLWNGKIPFESYETRIHGARVQSNGYYYLDCGSALFKECYLSVICIMVVIVLWLIAVNILPNLTTVVIWGKLSISYGPYRDCKLKCKKWNITKSNIGKIILVSWEGNKCNFISWVSVQAKLSKGYPVFRTGSPYRSIGHLSIIGSKSNLRCDIYKTSESTIIMLLQLCQVKIFWYGMWKKVGNHFVNFWTNLFQTRNETKTNRI